MKKKSSLLLIVFIAPLCMANAPMVISTEPIETVELEVEITKQDTNLYTFNVTNNLDTHCWFLINDYSFEAYGVTFSDFTIINSYLFSNEMLLAKSSKTLNIYLPGYILIEGKYPIEAETYTTVKDNINISSYSIDKSILFSTNEYYLKINTEDEAPGSGYNYIVEATYKGEKHAFSISSLSDSTFRTNERLDVKDLTIDRVFPYLSYVSSSYHYKGNDSMAGLYIAIIVVLLSIIVVPIIIALVVAKKRRKNKAESK